MVKKHKVTILSMQDDKTKHLSKVLSNESAKRVIDYLNVKEKATETQISTDLSLPLSTVHYSIQQLKKAKLITSNHFHYSEKGKEVQHYELIQDCIIISPKNNPSLLEAIKGIMPSFLITLLGTFFLYFTTKDFSSNYVEAKVVFDMASESDSMMGQANPIVTPTSLPLFQEPWFLFLLGGVIVITILIIQSQIKKK